jgi:putative DNA primase/helicase
MIAAAPLPLIAENIPLPLSQGKRFTAWRSEERKDQPKPAKMPYSPEAPKGASSASTADWVTFETAVKYANVAYLDGIMRAFDHADGMVGIDLDNCRDPETGELTPEATERVKRLDTYTEISPTGTGVKMWVYGTMPPFGHKKGDVEIYGSVVGKTGPCGRFFTMTGHQLPGTPNTVGYRPDAILALHREVFGDGPDLSAAALERDGDVPALQIGDEDVLRLASESAHNGARFRRLWDGDTGDYMRDGNDGASEADAALCEILAYYGGPDEARIERLWLRSGLTRDKTERADYRERTIKLALNGKTRFYGDSIQAGPEAGSDGASLCGCETCPAGTRVRYLERRLLDLDDILEAQRDILARKNAEVESLNRRIYADYRLSKVKTLTSAQKDTIRAISRVAVSRANYFDNGAPIITGQTLANEIGKHESTARAAADLVCNLPGSPVKRDTKPREDGERGMVTTYELAVRDPAAIIEQFVVIAENLEAKQSSRPQTPQCKQHPDAPVLIYSRHICGHCRKTLASTFPGEDALSVQNPRIAEAPQEPVSVRSTPVQNPRIGEAAGAEEVVSAEPVQVARVAPPVSLFDYTTTRPTEKPAPWRCRCGCLERYPGEPAPDEPWQCDGCGARGVDALLRAVAGGAE